MGYSDLHLPALLDYAREQDRIATFVAVRPNHSFHTVGLRADGEVTGITDLKDSGVLINGGYFVFKREIFRHIRPMRSWCWSRLSA